VWGSSNNQKGIAFDKTEIILREEGLGLRSVVQLRWLAMSDGWNTGEKLFTV